MNLYDFTVKDPKGEDVSLRNFSGKVLLIVNTATQCGFTPQYEGLEKLYTTYQNKGFEILDFPCNQFARQAPGTAEEIRQFCELHYHTTFPQFAKIDVNGTNESPLYTYLKEQQSGKLNARIKWNFTKFLISRTGEVVKRYASARTPDTIAGDIEKLLTVKDTH